MPKTGFIFSTSYKPLENLSKNIRRRLISMNEEVLNIQIRKFLKKVGIQSQREIVHAVRRSFEESSLVGIKKLEASILLKVPAVGIKVSVEGEIKLE